MPSKEAIEIAAMAIYESDHRGLKNCWRWEDTGLDDEHRGRRDRYLQSARAALDAAAAVDGDAQWNAAIEAAEESAIGAKLPEDIVCSEEWYAGHWHGRNDASLAIRALKRG